MISVEQNRHEPFTFVNINKDNGFSSEQIYLANQVRAEIAKLQEVGIQVEYLGACKFEDKLYAVWGVTQEKTNSEEDRQFVDSCVKKGIDIKILSNFPGSNHMHYYGVQL